MGLLSIRVVRPRLGFAVGVSIAAVLAFCAAFAGAAPAAVTGTASFTDPVGDAQGGPDVTGVTINGDATTGVISVSATLTGYPTAVTDGLERYVALWMDTDKNSATGDPEDGTEFGLQAWVDPTGRFWTAGRWNGSTFEEAAPTATFSRVGETLTWTVSTTDLGATSFRFYVMAGTWSEAEKRSLTRDRAPIFGWWEYDIAAGSTPTAPTPPTTTPPSSARLLIAAPTGKPKLPLAGKRFTVSFDVRLMKTESTVVIDIATGQTRESMITTWQPLSRGKTVANPSIGGKAIRSTASLREGELRVSMFIPKGASGKTLKVPVKITATESGMTVTASKVATFRIK